jgi:hypothetical protein
MPNLETLQDERNYYQKIAKRDEAVSVAKETKRRADKISSPMGIAVNTIEGLPSAGVKIAKYAGRKAKEVGKDIIRTAKGAIKGYKKGGKVKKTGLALIHKGERVLNKKQTKKFEDAKKQVFGIKRYGKS